jgi:hypothetical protein
MAEDSKRGVQPSQAVGSLADIPGGGTEAIIRLHGEAYEALVDVRERLQDRFLTSSEENHDADVVSLAITVLHRALGKSIVFIDPDTQRQDRALTSSVLWRPE